MVTSEGEGRGGEDMGALSDSDNVILLQQSTCQCCLGLCIIRPFSLFVSVSRVCADLDIPFWI